MDASDAERISPADSARLIRSLWDQYGQFAHGVQGNGNVWGNPYASLSFLPPTPVHNPYADRKSVV